MTNMQPLKVDRTKLYTQAEYAKLVGKTRSWVNKKIANGDLKTVKINGAILVTIE